MKREALLSGKNLQKIAVYLAFIVFFVFFSISLRNVGSGFLDLGNLMNILRQTSLIAIIAIGMTFALGAAQIDLSIGPIVGVTSLVTSLVLKQYGILPGVVAGIAVGAVVGSLNGVLTSALKVPAFLATLGTQIIFAGVARTLTNLKSVPIMDKSFKYLFGGGDIGFFPILAIWMILFVGVGYIVMVKTGFGRRVIAAGSNPTAAFYSGVNVKKTIFSVMLLSGVLAGIAGVLWAGRFGGGRYSLGEGEELSVIAATVLGGTSIYGGRATVLGAAVGAIMIGMINNALILYGLDVYQQMIIRGIIIIAAVALTTTRE
jgi:ribose transport system permease protein